VQFRDERLAEVLRVLKLRRLKEITHALPASCMLIKIVNIV